MALWPLNRALGALFTHRLRDTGCGMPLGVAQKCRKAGEVEASGTGQYPAGPGSTLWAQSPIPLAAAGARLFPGAVGRWLFSQPVGGAQTIDQMQKNLLWLADFSEITSSKHSSIGY